jgi:hypothetical protein
MSASVYQPFLGIMIWVCWTAETGRCIAYNQLRADFPLSGVFQPRHFILKLAELISVLLCQPMSGIMIRLCWTTHISRCVAYYTRRIYFSPCGICQALKLILQLSAAEVGGRGSAHVRHHDWPILDR